MVRCGRRAACVTRLWADWLILRALCHVFRDMLKEREQHMLLKELTDITEP